MTLKHVLSSISLFGLASPDCQPSRSNTRHTLTLSSSFTHTHTHTMSSSVKEEQDSADLGSAISSSQGSLLDLNQALLAIQTHITASSETDTDTAPLLSLCNLRKEVRDPASFCLPPFLTAFFSCPLLHFHARSFPHAPHTHTHTHSLTAPFQEVASRRHSPAHPG